MAVALQTLSAAKELLLECLGEEGEVIPGKHFLEQLEEENLTFPDCLHVLRYGNLCDSPEQDVKTGAWKYRIEGQEPDGKWIAVIFCFKRINRAFLITVFSIRGR